MRITRNPILIGFALVMGFGIVVYLRLWIIDYRISSDETDFLRRQFDLANREAMDESAEWRLKYDEEAERANKCVEELTRIKDAPWEKNAAAMNKRLDMLQKENINLLERVEALQQELEAEKLKCSMQRA